MPVSKPVLLIGLLFSAASLASAQQTGIVVATKPGAAAGTGIVVRTVVPNPTCDLSANEAGGEVPSLPEMVFGRQWNELICIRHRDGKTEQLAASTPNGVPSSDGSAIAYWNQPTHELHIYFTATKSDLMVENLPGAKLRDMAWSAKGHMLSYFPTSASPSGIRSYDADTGKWVLFGGSFVGVVAPPDARHVVAVNAEGVKSFSLADATSEVTAKVSHAASAEYSHGGKYLGILGNSSIAEQNAPPAPAPVESEDEPDCRGAAFALIVQDTRTKQLVDVPYPKGFDTVLDFSFSPDEKSIAVTFGVVGCDYPGERAQVFLVSLPDLKLTLVSPEDQLSLKPVWTPDGKAIVYSDYYTGSDSPLVAFDLRTHRVTRLTSPGQFGPDEWLGWR